MNIFTSLKNDITTAFNELYKDSGIILENIGIEIPKDVLNGDLSSNIAMILASKLPLQPREIALKFKERLAKIPYIAHIEVAGPGFINFTIKASSWQNCIKDILQDKNYFNQTTDPKATKINLEYVSANPTGPMHIGHARGAVYGDVLANILIRCGYDVTKEFYINDAGSQIDTLAETVFLRYQEALNNQKQEIPAGLYPGEYLIPTGRELAAVYGNKLLNLPSEERANVIKNFVISEMLQLIKDDLKDLGVVHDVFKSEKELHDQGAVIQAIQKLEIEGKIYNGKLPPPKGKITEDWEDREQLLFKATDFGDDQDRPLKKSSGEWTYLAADIAYAEDKISRGFNELIYVLGADHNGYIKRINAFVSALSDNKVRSAVKICQLVNFVKNGKPFKMSKRTGNFTTVRDIIDIVGKDIVRFMMISRKNDSVLEFDLEKVKEQTKDNPVFYVQYAHVRALSILENAREKLPVAYDLFIKNEYDLTHLESEKELQLIKLLAAFSKTIESCAQFFEPHRLVLYLEDIAAKFHALWTLGKDGANYRFIVENNEELTCSRLALAKAVQLVVAEGLKLIGIKALDRM
jgi:arginyl-tRNA synthetase